MLRYPLALYVVKSYCYTKQLIRDLKDEISKLRDFIRAEGLEGKVSAFGKHQIDMVNVILECLLT